MIILKNQIETQNERPTNEISLDSVGISQFKSLLLIKRNGKTFHLTPTIEVSINLPADIKGVHMSRICESVVDIINDERNAHHSVEEMSIQVLKRLKELHPFTKGHLSMNFDFFYETQTPVSKKQSFEVVNVTVNSWLEKEKSELVEICVEYIGNTVCPHAMENNPEKRTHIQRATGKLCVKGELDQMPSFESMVEILKRSFPAETYSILKTEDEQAVIDNMYAHPMFVEDVCRSLLANAKRDYASKKLQIFVNAKSLESIHKHNVFAKGSAITGKE